MAQVAQFAAKHNLETAKNIANDTELGIALDLLTQTVEDLISTPSVREDFDRIRQEAMREVKQLASQKGAEGGTLNTIATVINTEIDNFLIDEVRASLKPA